MVHFRNAIYTADALKELRQIPDETVQTCVTSPPYWGLRDYGVEDQLGLEKTPGEYVAKMVEIFREVKRVLRNNGTLWLILGDSYSGSRTGLKPKDLIGIPWMVAFALQSDGWYLRSDIIWAKPNPMPESITDRPTRSHEYIFLLTKSPKYYYNAQAIKEPSKNPQDDVPRLESQKTENKSNPTSKQNGLRPRKSDKQRGHSPRHAGFNDRWNLMTKEEQGALMRNKRDVWAVATKPYGGAHFAVFPPALIIPCILAGSQTGDCVLDPFAGSGTTLEVAKRLGRDYIGIELNSKYVRDLIEPRLANINPLFLGGDK